MFEYRNATDVRSGFSQFVDSVVREGLAVVKRNRDNFAAISLPQLDVLLSPYRFQLKEVQEEDGSVSGALQQIDRVGNAPTTAELRRFCERDRYILTNQLQVTPEYFNQKI